MARGNSRDFILNVIADATKADREMDGFAANAGKVAAGIGAAFSAINLADAIGGNLDGAVEVSDGKAWLEASLGGIETYAAEAGKVAGDLFDAGFTDSMRESSEAVAAVVKNLNDLDPSQIDGLSRSALSLASAMGEDVTKVVGAASSLFNSGLAPSAEAAFDIIAAGQASNVDKAEDLLDTLIEYSIVFDQIGLDGPTSLGLMNQALTAGARNSDIAADALKEWAIRAQEAMSTPVDPSAITAAQQAVTDSYAEAGRAAETAADNITSAEDRVVDAQRSAKAAQVDLTAARRDAAEAIRDLNDQLTNAAFSERGAELAITRAEEAMSKAAQDNDGLAFQEAQLRYDQAVQNLKEARDRTKELKAEKRAADRDGVNGSEQVRSAQERVAEADRRIAEAQAEVQDARREAADSAVESTRRIQDAQAALAAASTPQLTAIGLAYQKLGLDGNAIGQAVAAGGDEAKAALDTVLDQLRQVEDPAMRAQLAVELFGTKSEDMQKALYAMDVDTAADGFRNIDGAATDLGDTLGKGLGDDVQSWQNRQAQWMEELMTMPGVFGDVAQGMMIYGPSITSILGPLALGMVALSGASTAFTVGSAGLILALALIAGAAWLIYENWDHIQAGFANTWDWLQENWPLLLPLLLGPFGAAIALATEFGDDLLGFLDAGKDAAVDLWQDVKGGASDAAGWVGDKVDDMIGFFTGIPSAIGDVFGDLGDGLMVLAHDAATGIAWLWNNSIGLIGLDIPGWGPFPGINFSVPNIKVPALADGGIALGPALALVGEGRGPEAIIPLDRLSEFTSGGSRRVEVPIYLDGRVIARAVADINLEDEF